MSRIGQTFPYQAGDLNQDGTQAWGPLERAVLSSLIDTVQQAVNVDGLDVNGNLDLHGHGCVNAAFVQFVLSGDAGSLRQQWVDSSGDLWYRDGQNRTVQVTSGGALAVGASTGGFAGDYISTNPSGATYDNSTGKFTFTAPSPSGQAAIINGGPIQLRAGTDTDYVGLAVPASLPGTYTLTFPSTLPAGQQSIVVCDATGGLNYRLSASFTEAIDVAAADGPSVTYGDNGQSISNSTVDLGIPFNLGDRIDAVSLGFVNTIAPVATTASLQFRNDAGGGLTQIARLCFNDGVGGAHVLQAGAATLTGTLPYTPPASGTLFARLSCAGTLVFTSCRVTRLRKLIS